MEIYTDNLTTFNEATDGMTYEQQRMFQNMLIGVISGIMPPTEWESALTQALATMRKHEYI